MPQQKRRARRRTGLRAQQVQFLIAMEDWDALRAAVGKQVSDATLRSVVSEYKARADEGNQRAQRILEQLKELGIRPGFGGRGARAPRVPFDQPVVRKVQVVKRKTEGARTYVLSGISLRPYVDPEEPGVKPLPKDLAVTVTYRKAGRIEIGW
jgi:hypothetical protein